MEQLELTFCAAGSRVRTFPLQDSAPALLELAPASGTSTSASSRSSRRRSSSSRTCLDCGLVACVMCWPDLPLSGSMRSGRVSVPPSSGRRTSGGVSSSLLPTPTASTYGGNQGGSNGRVGPVRHSLTTLAKMGVLPTPRASAAAHVGSTPTPHVMERIANGRATLEQHAIAGLLPTPTVCGNHNRKGASPTSGDGLATAVGGRLSARFVEWMMGFPIDHTDVD